jgi:hypothetical protein
VDAVKLWGPTVVTLSLGLPTVMRFTKPKVFLPYHTITRKNIYAVKERKKEEWRKQRKEIQIE